MKKALEQSKRLLQWAVEQITAGQTVKVSPSSQEHEALLYTISITKQKKADVLSATVFMYPDEYHPRKECSYIEPFWEHRGNELWNIAALWPNLLPVSGPGKFGTVDLGRYIGTVATFTCQATAETDTLLQALAADLAHNVHEKSPVNWIWIETDDSKHFADTHGARAFEPIPENEYFLKKT